MYTQLATILFLSQREQQIIGLPSPLSGLIPQKKLFKEKILIFFPKKSLILKNFLYFWKWNLALSGLSHQSFCLKNVLHFFLKRPDLKKFLIFSQKSLSNFQETKLSYIQNPRHIQNTVEHLVHYLVHLLAMAQKRLSKKVLIFSGNGAF